jgi:hypothetical protein
MARAREVPVAMGTQGFAWPRVHRSMYRSNFDGLTEQIRALEEQKRRLETDLVGMTRIRWPQRALRVAIALLVLLGAGVLGSALGYRHAVVELRRASQEDARTALYRIEQCHGRLRQVLTSKRDLDEEWAAEEHTTASGF